jgi:uncharacterized protein
VTTVSRVQRCRALVMSMLQQGLIGLVQGYRLFFKVWLGNRCRFEPTCSAYALQALRQHGAGAGAVLTTRRVLRCHPWCEGGHDPVPGAKGRHGLATQSENPLGAQRSLFRKNP